MRYLVHLCEFGGYLFVVLPSETKRFREEMLTCGVPYRMPWSSRPAYRVPLDFREQLLSLIRLHYPGWELNEVTGFPPYVEEGMATYAGQWPFQEDVPPALCTLFDRTAIRLSAAGAHVQVVPYRDDASQHLHVKCDSEYACLIFRCGGLFDHARLGDHRGHVVHEIRDVEEWLGIRTASRQGVRS